MDPLWKKQTMPMRCLWALYDYVLRLIRWIGAALKDWRNWIIFGVVYLAMTSPTWAGWLLFIITGDPWHLTYATAYMAVWALPFTPLIPLCIAIALGIRKLFQHKK